MRARSQSGSPHGYVGQACREAPRTTGPCPPVSPLAAGSVGHGRGPRPVAVREAASPSSAIRLTSESRRSSRC